jgi:hypothetical protein
LLNIESYSSVVQLVSIRILLFIVAKHRLKIISENTRNAFSYADVLEKLYAIARLEFREREGCIVKIVKNICGIATSSRA